MKYQINGRDLQYETNGERHFGPPVQLLDHAIDLTDNSPWHQKGFTIETLFPNGLAPTFIENTKALLFQLWRDAGLSIPDNFPLEQYHTLATRQEHHLKAVDKTKLLTVDRFPFDIHQLEARISSLLHQSLHVYNPFDDQKIFHFRVVRPLSGDNNPLHRDVWLEDYKDCINLYIPIAGSNEHSSLILAPGSHLWAESSVERTTQGADIKGQKFNVPAVTNILEACEMIRPNPKVGEVLIFSPYLIHGGAVNLNTDKTRISIEIRLWRK